VADAEGVARLEDIAAKVLEEIERPSRRLLFLGLADGAKGQFEAEAADLAVGGFLGPQFAEAIGDEVPVRARLGFVVASSCNPSINSSTL
jgi:hypothetical protein